MKNKEIISATVGGCFFAIPYLALSAPIIPSLLIGMAAFGAGELVLGENKLTLKDTNRSLYDKLKVANKQNKHILDMIPRLDKENLRKQLHEIYDSVSKITATIAKHPEKAKKIDNFFDYYLPITVKLIDRYDEIENQKISSQESEKFFDSTNKMIDEISKAYKKILSDLYRKDIVDMDVEMKVFDSLLKADGFNDADLQVKKEEK